MFSHPFPALLAVLALHLTPLRPVMNIICSDIWFSVCSINLIEYFPEQPKVVPSIGMMDLMISGSEHVSPCQGKYRQNKRIKDQYAPVRSISRVAEKCCEQDQRERQKPVPPIVASNSSPCDPRHTDLNEIFRCLGITYHVDIHRVYLEWNVSHCQGIFQQD